ncbi:hypothetical protein PVAND_006346 [Polypedilum vanderplanki]|uniref:Uncharacterized protein n=1 Tax=Polypedilum vanderplanki TaxID=319348 RepID=A0A9J6C3N8_POLVA|nr:hypothetical protein PVAND_006346 [Polypedilum vanderplanki]
MEFIERSTARELQEYTKMLNDILEHKFTNGSDPSDDMLFNTLVSTIEMLRIYYNPWINCDVYYTTFNFFAKMDFTSPKFIQYILDSELMDFIERALVKSPSYIIEEAILFFHNLVTLASDEHIPKFYDFEFIQVLINYIRYSKMSQNHLQNIGKLAFQTLELLYQKSEEVLARKRLSRA